MEEYYDTETHRVVRPDEIIEAGQNPSAAAIMKLMQNPGQLSGLFKLDDKQAKNVKGGVAALGAFLGTKYLSEAVGDEIAAGVGAVAAAFIAKKLFGSSQ